MFAKTCQFKIEILVASIQSTAMSKLSIIILGIFLVLGTINFISALPCGTGGYIPRNLRILVNATENRDLIELPDTDGETIIRKIRETASSYNRRVLGHFDVTI